MDDRALLDPREVKAWVAAHPGGQVLTVDPVRCQGAEGGPEYQAPFRGPWLQAWRGAARGAARAALD